MQRLNAQAEEERRMLEEVFYIVVPQTCRRKFKLSSLFDCSPQDGFYLSLILFDETFSFFLCFLFEILKKCLVMYRLPPVILMF